MHRTLRRFGRSLVWIYLILFLQTFLGGWFPIGVVRPELDLLVLGFYALQGQPFQALLLGFWSGLLRDSLTEGPRGGWVLSLTLFSLALALQVRDKRIGLVKKSLLLSAAIVASHTLVFLFQEKGFREGGLYLRFFLQTFLPSACLTGVTFLLGIRLLQRWLSGSGSIQINA